jgi:predicted DNA-binding protein (MmcQ/YjbR family)
MTNDAIRAHCLSLPHTTEVVQWVDRLLFKVAGKMFAIITLDGHACAFRCTPERYGELIEMADIVPASHNMWKYHWVTTETLSAVSDREYRELLSESYRIVRATLPARVRTALDAGADVTTVAASPSKRRRTPAAGSRSTITKPKKK